MLSNRDLHALGSPYLYKDLEISKRTHFTIKKLDAFVLDLAGTGRFATTRRLVVKGLKGLSEHVPHAIVAKCLPFLDHLSLVCLSASFTAALWELFESAGGRSGQSEIKVSHLKLFCSPSALGYFDTRPASLPDSIVKFELETTYNRVSSGFLDMLDHRASGLKHAYLQANFRPDQNLDLRPNLVRKIRSFRVAFGDMSQFCSLPGLDLESLDVYAAGTTTTPPISSCLDSQRNLKSLWIAGSNTSIIFEGLRISPLEQLTLWNASPDIDLELLPDLQTTLLARSPPLRITFIQFENQWDWEIAWQEREFWQSLDLIASFKTAWRDEEPDSEDEAEAERAGTSFKKLWLGGTQSNKLSEGSVL